MCLERWVQARAVMMYDVVDVVQLRQKENGPIIRPIIVEFQK